MITLSTLTIIVPCYNEIEVLQATYDQLCKTLSLLDDLRWQILLVDDGSRDGSDRLMDHLAETDSRVRVIHFSRNFGHQAAVTAGLLYADSDYAVVLDADLQDPPPLILEMWAKMKETHANVVYGVRRIRQGETLFKKLTAKYFYRFLNSMSDAPFPEDSGDFRLVDRRVLDTFKRLGEHNKYIRGLISWMGFKQIPIYYERSERVAGTTKYTLKDMFRLAFDAVSYFSDRPLRIVTSLGFFSVLLGLALLLWTFLGKVLGFTHPESGWTSIVIIVIFFGGVQLLCMGVLGRYIGVIFDEVKSRPEFIISHTKNMESEKDSPNL